MSSTVSSGPVTPGERVSDVLARDEALVEVFVEHSEHFAKLRNKAMRHVMARLVTVEQAARVAGVSADVLVRSLNAALGIAPPDVADAASGAAADAPAAREPSQTHPPLAPVVTVDVREDLRAGREPFSKIMTAVGTLGDGEVLRLRAIFEPAPLFGVLGKRGFLSESVQEGPQDWSVWFWRPAEAVGAGEPAAAPATPAPNDANAEAAPGEVWLDVRGLQPPEPLMRTLAALETLPDGQTLVQVNVRVPQFLLPVLAERGFTCAIDESRPERVLVRIWRPM